MYLPFASIGIHTRFYGGVRAAHLFSFLCCPVMYRYIHCNVAMWFIVNVLQLSNKTILHCSTLMVSVSHSITQRVVPISQSYVVLR